MLGAIGPANCAVYPMLVHVGLEMLFDETFDVIPFAASVLRKRTSG